MDNSTLAIEPGTGAQPYEKIGVNNTFKTSIAGFNKEAVLYYIDNLRKESAQQQRTYTVEIDRLYEKNIELNRTMANINTEKESLMTRVEQERKKQSLMQEENSLLGNVVEKLQLRVAQLGQDVEAQRLAASQLEEKLRESSQRESELQNDTAEKLRQAAQREEALRNAVAVAQQRFEQAQKLQYQNSQLSQQINYLNGQIKTREQLYAQRARKYEETIAYFRLRYENAGREAEQLRSQLAPAQELKRQNDSLVSQIQALQQRVNALQQESAAQNSYASQLMERLKNANRANRGYTQQTAYPQTTYSNYSYPMQYAFAGQRYAR